MVLRGVESLGGRISQALHRCNIVFMSDDECVEVSRGCHVSTVYRSKTKELGKAITFDLGLSF
jgi:hypothetical protein